MFDSGQVSKDVFVIALHAFSEDICVSKCSCMHEHSEQEVML